MKVVIIGASGLLGSACLRIFNENPKISAIGTFRYKFDCNKFPYDSKQHYFLPDAFDVKQIKLLFQKLQPSLVINCTSLSKNKLLQSFINEIR